MNKFSCVKGVPKNDEAKPLLMEIVHYAEGLVACAACTPSLSGGKNFPALGLGLGVGYFLNELKFHQKVIYNLTTYFLGEPCFYLSTNNFNLSPKTIADIYKSRWEVEQFFKWIKQNLKIKSFLGERKNAVMKKIWFAICSYLIVKFIKTKSKTTRSMQQILLLLNLNAFEKKSLSDLVSVEIDIKGNLMGKQLKTSTLFGQTMQSFKIARSCCYY